MTPEVAERLARALAAQLTIGEACRIAGISRKTFERYRAIGDELLEECDARAEASGTTLDEEVAKLHPAEQRYVRFCREVVRKRDETLQRLAETVIAGAMGDAAQGVPANPELALSALGRLHPRWGVNQRVQLTGEGGEPIRFYLPQLEGEQPKGGERA